MNESIKFIKSGRGTVLLFDGYRFHTHTNYKKGTSLWRCDNYKKTKLNCKGSVTLSADKSDILIRKPHSGGCISDEAQNLIEATVNEHCAEASLGREPAPRVFKRALATITEKGWDLVANKPIPTFNEKKSSIYRQRNKIAGVDKICHTDPEEVEVPLQYESFLLADYSCNGMRIIIFSSKDARECLTQSEHMFMDGTFKSCPSPFRQIYTIHADIGSDSDNTNIVPLVFAFMTHQTKEAYTALFSLIKAQVPGWQPKKVTIDFERATLDALSEFNVKIMGCHYHFSNALFRKAKAIGLKRTKPNIRIISLCSKLAFLPHYFIPDGWAYIRNEMGSDDSTLTKFSEYFEAYWMKGDFYRTWCMYGEKHRTNNSCEGWHHSLNVNINRNEGRLLQVLHLLFQEANITSFRSHRLQKFKKSTGPKRRNNVRVYDDRILTAQKQLMSGEISVGHFLEKLR